MLNQGTKAIKAEHDYLINQAAKDIKAEHDYMANHAKEVAAGRESYGR